MYLNNYADIENYINALPKFAEGNGLLRTKEMLKRLEKWDCDIPRIHVAGTNGKGSTCAYLQRLFCEYGYRVGGFVSPHLVSMHERFLINCRPVENEVFLDAFRVVYLSAEQMREETGEFPAFFEFLFLMAIIIFGESHVDVMILETGLGGRMDATNVFDKTDVCVLTSIGLDHCHILGDTREKIAMEKAGIIKNESNVIFIDYEDSVSDVFYETSKSCSAVVNSISKNQYSVEKIKHKSIDFSYKSSYYNYISLTLSTYALYQVENASLALRAFEVFLLRNHLTPMSKEKMQKALQNTFWEGRMEEVGKDVFFDGAHNEDGIRAFLKTVSSIPCDGKRILCFSAVDDKDYEQMITLLCESGLFSKAVVIDMETQRGLSIEQLQCYFSRFSLTDIYYERGAEDGINRCLRMKKDNDQVYIVGSLYLVGLIKAVFRRKYND